MHERGFTSIAPELRNMIYAEVFRVEAEASLLESSPPSKALLLTCRKVYDEVKEMYTDAHRKYWAETAFTLVVPHAPPPSVLGSANGALWESMEAHKLYDQVSALDASSIPHIKKLRVELEDKTQI